MKIVNNTVTFLRSVQRSESYIWRPIRYVQDTYPLRHLRSDCTSLVRIYGLNCVIRMLHIIFSRLHVRRKHFVFIEFRPQPSIWNPNFGCSNLESPPE